MGDLHRRVAEASRELEPQYSTLESTLFEAEVRRRHHERGVRRRVTASVIAVLIAGGGLFAWNLTHAPSLPEVAIGEDARVVMPIGAPVRTVKSEPGLVWLEVERATVHFVVAPQHGRTVRVSADGVDVEVVGTAFNVTREGAGRVRVEVTEGKVRVRAGQRESLLSKGEQGLFQAPPPVAAVEDASPPPEEEIEDPPAPEDPAGPPVVKRLKKAAKRSSTWRALAEKGDFGNAWNALQQEEAPEDEPGDLLRAADVARLSGHPAASLAPLRRVLSNFDSDPRASLAAFTLGRVLLDDLGNPREAVDAFLRAHALAPRSPLAPDALARAVEAQARAGDTEAARVTAQKFLRDYPQSGRVEAVKKWGGL